MSALLKVVICVPGNHEYYVSPPVYISDYQLLYPDNSPHTMGDCMVRFTKLCASYKNVHILNNSSVMIGGVNYVGSTLWSHTPTKLHADIVERVWDFGKIWKTSTDNVTPDDCNQLHTHSVDYLDEQINGEKVTTPTVVITHFNPLPATDGDSKDIVDTHFYHSPPSVKQRLIKESSPVKLWVYGHTHIPDDQTVNGIRMVNNPFIKSGEFVALRL